MLTEARDQWICTAFKVLNDIFTASVSVTVRCDPVIILEWVNATPSRKEPMGREVSEDHKH